MVSVQFICRFCESANLTMVLTISLLFACCVLKIEHVRLSSSSSAYVSWATWRITIPIIFVRQLIVINGLMSLHEAILMIHDSVVLS